MAYTAAVITVSDKGSRGEREDTSGPAVRKILEDAGFSVVHTCILPDEK
ncbi:MAG: molybdenum cofactor biosynthesis protein, partial [Oscillospiraceae bacterium]|nr:molybdenum cofactor biosynthesis protein [Oscillospiraceae bacterium]